MAQEWHPDRNAGLSPDSVSAGSNKSYWWLCPNSPCQHAHEWFGRVYSRLYAKSGCPYCAGMKVCPCNSLAGKHQDLAAEWDYDQNEGPGPEHCGPSSHRKVWWRHTGLHGQECSWQMLVYKRTRQGQGCPECAARKYVNAHSAWRYVSLHGLWHASCCLHLAGCSSIAHLCCHLAHAEPFGTDRC